MGKYFTDVKGQDSAVKILSAQLSGGNLSHAYIILGPDGAGKEYLAREFARYILCEKGVGDTCASCVRFDHNSHPDFILVDGKNGIKIDEVRGAIERVNLSPNLSKRKVLLFTQAENLGIEAANALLKTFEEPPEDCIIILTALSEKSLPSTIISRGQKIKLTDLNKKDIQDILSREFPEEDIEKVLALSSENIGQARKMLQDQNEYLNLKSIHNDIITLVSSDSVIEKFNIIDAYDKEKKLKEFFDVFAGHLFKAVAGKVSGDGEKEEKNIFMNLSLSNLASLGHKTLKIYGNLEYNINLKLVMEEMILDNLIVRG